MRSYRVGRILFTILALLAWVGILAGGVTAMLGMAFLHQMPFGRDLGGGFFILGAVPGVFIGILAVLCLAGIQNGRATIDTAELTQQMLKVARDQLDVSNQGQHNAQAMARSFTDLTFALGQTVGSGRLAAAPPEQSGWSRHAETASAPPAQPAPATIAYQGETIERDGDRYRVGEMSFVTLKSAQEHIDGRQSGHPIPLGGLSAHA